MGIKKLNFYKFLKRMCQICEKTNEEGKISVVLSSNFIQRMSLLRSIYSDVIQFRGSHYDYGLLHGKQIKDSLILKSRMYGWKIRRPRFEINVKETREMFFKFAPSIWEELEGLRDGLHMTMEEVLLHFGGYRTEIDKSGCSIFTTNQFMIRNYDFHPQTYEGRYTLFQPTDGGFAIIGPSSRITGRMDGMNEHGLVMGYNFTHRKKPGTGFTCTMIGRMVLQMCRTVEEAVALIKELPHRGSFSYVLLDQKGDTAIVEASPRHVIVRVDQVCTNHFEVLKEENRYHLDDSFERMNVINRNKTDLTNPYDAFRLFNDRERGVFSEKYKSWAGTIHTSAYFPKEKKVWFALGGDQEPYIFDFGKWIEGEKLNVKQIHGKVNTDLSFAHLK